MSTTRNPPTGGDGTVFWRLNTLRFGHVTREYRTDQETGSALVNVPIEAGAGEFTALVGCNGCRKSTLRNLAGATNCLTSGSVLLDNTDTSALDERRLTQIRRAKVRFSLQFFHPLPTLARVENVEHPLMLAGEADELIGNLDPAAADVVMALLNRTTKGRGATVLMATPGVEAAAVSDTVVCLGDGQIEEVKRQRDAVTP